MSLRALTWAFDLDLEELTPTLKFVLITLANYAGEDDETYPRQSTIAKKTGYTRQTVNDSLGRLQDMHLIAMTRRVHETGAFRSSVYKLLIPADHGRVKFDDTADNDNGRVSNRTTRHDNDNDKDCRPSRQGLSASPTEDVGDADNLNRELEPSPEPSQEPSRKAAKPRKTAPWPADYRDQFWKAYPKRPGNSRKEALDALDRIEASDRVEFSELMTGLGYYAERMAADVKRDPSNVQYIIHAVRWLKKERWANEEPAPTGPPRAKRRVAI